MITAKDIEKILTAKYDNILILRIEEKQAGGQGSTFLCSWESHSIINTAYLKIIDIKSNVERKFERVFPRYSDREWLEFAIEQIPRFKAEADYYRSFSNIKEVINIYDSWLDDKTFSPYPVLVISFEPKEGDISKISFEERTEGLGKKLCLSIAKGLFQMTERVEGGVFLHKDIKQENILYDTQNGDYAFYIADLGVSKALNELEIDGTIVNHERFALQDNVYTSESDIYLLGILLYSFLNGWSANEFQKKLNKDIQIFEKKTGEFLLPKPEAISDEKFWQLIKQMLYREKQKRPTLVQIIAFFENNSKNNQNIQVVQSRQNIFKLESNHTDIDVDQYENYCVESIREILRRKDIRDLISTITEQKGIPNEVWDVLFLFIKHFKDIFNFYSNGYLTNRKEVDNIRRILTKYFEEENARIRVIIPPENDKVVKFNKKSDELLDELNDLFFIYEKESFCIASLSWLRNFVDAYTEGWCYYYTYWILGFETVESYVSPRDGKWYYDGKPKNDYPGFAEVGLKHPLLQETPKFSKYYFKLVFRIISIRMKKLFFDYVLLIFVSLALGLLFTKFLGMW